MSDDLVKRFDRRGAITEYNLLYALDRNPTTINAGADICAEAKSTILFQANRIEELERKLAKAIGDLGRLSRAEVFGDGGAWGMRLSEDALGREILARMKFARTTLAELTGGNDE